MPDHPYKDQPEHAFWSRAVGAVDLHRVDPVAKATFRIKASDRVVTAGSCFAQHLTRALIGAGLNLFITEEAHPYMDPDACADFGYGLFSARYGNIYNARHLLQLLQRAMGTFVPRDQFWERDGRFFDPFRTGVQPTGFETLRELELDRAQHLRAVLRAFSQMDVFVFTLGLTECWASNFDGAVYSSCPGVTAGHFDRKMHSFINMDVSDVVNDLLSFVSMLAPTNPDFKIVLTVAPVALAATASDEHVLTANTYSKSVLRVAATTVARALPKRAAYFPAYEIITGAHSRGHYFASDLRNVTEQGVAHVMQVFARHYLEAPGARVAPMASKDAEVAVLKKLLDADCEESLLDQRPA